MPIKKEIIMKVSLSVNRGGYVSAKLKGVDNIYNISMREGIITDEEHARLMFSSIMKEIFDEQVLGIIKTVKK